MPREQLSMRKIKEILRLKWESKLGDRQVAKSCGVSRSTVSDYVSRAKAAGLCWPLPVELDEGALAGRLFPRIESRATQPPLPEWSDVQRELKRKGVTRWLLWSEYKDRCPDGIQYSQYCQRYRDWRATQSVVMRQDHKAGEKLFVDYAGMSLEVIDRHTGEVRKASIFVATLGASNYTYAEATLSQTLPDWLGSHARALTFFGGCPAIIVPDNLKTGVTDPCFYEPDLNPSYLDLARHYRLAVIPARVKRPRDKAKVEVHVQIVEREILAPLRDRAFFSLDELNAVIRQGVDRLNHRPLQKQGTSRAHLFAQLDQPALRPLPHEPYRFAEWKRAKVHSDYHIELTGHYYSVPYRLVRQTVEVRFNNHTVEIFRKAERVASHRRSFQRGAHTTVPEHMPKAHQRAGNMTPQRLIDWAHNIGPDTEAWVQVALKRRPHPEQGFRTCLGALKLAKRYGNDRLNAACKRALIVNAFSYRSLESMLKHKLDQQPLPQDKQTTIALPDHDNVRGPDYFH